MSQQRPNNDLKIAIWSVVVIVVALAAIIIVKVSTNGSSGKTTGSTVAPASLMAKITSLDATTFDAVGQGTATKLPQPLPGAAPLTQNGKPEIFFMGAEYCPYCATERWPMVIALSRFGTFSNLGLTTSSATDAYPSTATFAFHGSTYTSQYIAFTAVEETTNQPNGSGGYTTLDTPTAAEKQLITTYDAPPYVAASSAGSIPFIDFGGMYLITGSTYDPGVLQGKTQDQIADSLSDTSSAISKGAVGAANSITAAICSMTNNQPSSVCSSSVIQKLQSQLGK